MSSSQVKPASTVSSEDILSRKTDECLANAIVKGGLGLSAGRAFPVWLLTGAGLGSAYTECQISFNPTAVPGYRMSTPQTGSSSSSMSEKATPLVKEAELAFQEAKAKVESKLPKQV